MMMDRTKLLPYWTYLWIISILMVGACQQINPPLFWPESGTSIRNITWEIPVADSASVLRTQAGHWILPQPPDSAEPRITVTRHREPTVHPYGELLGRVDQEVVHESGVVIKEYYRFGKEGIMVLGYEARDPTNQLTVYEPPMMLFPRNMDNLDAPLVSEQIPKIWAADADSFRREQKMRIRLTPGKKGTVLLDSVSVPALLCKMSLSADKTVPFGGTDLIVPEAFVMESKVLIAEGIGPVLEWGIRSREKEEENRESSLPEDISQREDADRFQEREYYIEVALHRAIVE
ncbi:MAG: hypothetical protein JSV84_05460 [Gemmatimonadota bacterium]|nr:MAG: hypothetical protein JSV84_05460 [Gemmatimonadota bacterium]